MIDELFRPNPWLLLCLQGTACLVAGLAASFALRRRAARAHQVLLTALLASLLTPGLSLAAKHFGLGVFAPKTVSSGQRTVEVQPLDSSLPADAPAAQTARKSTPPSMAGPVIEVPAATRVPWGLAVACWLTATVVLLTRLALRFLLGLHLLRTADPLEAEPIGRAVEEARSRLGIERRVQIRHSAKVQSPVIWCWDREPVLLLQKAAAACPEGTDWVGIFCHEISHWRRLDHATGLFAELLTAMFPWHPLLWWAKGRLLRLSERACDDWVVATGQPGVDYAETLLSLAAQRQMAFLPMIAGKDRTMKTRIHRIIKDGCGNPRVGTRWTLAVSIAAALASVGIALAQQAPVPPQPPEPPQAQTPSEPRDRQAAPDPAEARQRESLDQAIQQVTATIRQKEALLRERSHLPLERESLRSDIEVLRWQIQRLEWERQNPGRAAQNPFGSGGMQRWTISGTTLWPPALERLLRPAEVEPATEPKPALEESLPQLQARAGELRTELRARPGMKPEIAAALRKDLAQLDAKIRERQEQLRVRIAEVEKEMQERKERAGGEQPEDRECFAELYAMKALLRASEDVAAAREQPATPQRIRRAATETEGRMRAQTRVYALEHIRPEKMQAIVEALIDKPESVTLYAEGRKAAVYATAENQQRLQRIVRIIDVPEEEYTAGVKQDGTFERMQAITLRHSSPKRMHSLLAAVLDQTGRVSLDERTRTLIVSTTLANMGRVESIVRALDVPADDRVFETEVEELRSQMRGLNEQMQQMQRRLDQIAERDRGPTMP